MYGSREYYWIPFNNNHALSDPNPNPKGLQGVWRLRTSQAMMIAYERGLNKIARREKALGRPLTEDEKEKIWYVTRDSPQEQTKMLQIANRIYDLPGGDKHEHPFSEKNPPMSSDQCKATPYTYIVKKIIGHSVCEDDGDVFSPCGACFVSEMRIAKRFESLLSDKNNKEYEEYVDLIHNMRDETLAYIKERKADKTYAPEPYIHYYDILDDEGTVREFAKAVSDLDTDTVCEILEQLLRKTMMEQQSEQSPILKIAAEAIDKCMKNI